MQDIDLVVGQFRSFAVRYQLDELWMYESALGEQEYIEPGAGTRYVSHMHSVLQGSAELHNIIAPTAAIRLLSMVCEERTIDLLQAATLVL